MELFIGTLADDGFIYCKGINISEVLKTINRNKIIDILHNKYNINKKLLNNYKYYYYSSTDDVTILQDDHEIINDINIVPNYTIIIDNDIQSFLNSDCILLDHQPDEKLLIDESPPPYTSSSDISSSDISNSDMKETIKYNEDLCDYFSDIDFLKLLLLLKQTPDVLNVVEDFISHGCVYEKFNNDNDISNFNFEKQLKQMKMLKVCDDEEKLKKLITHYNGDTNCVLQYIAQY